MKKFITIALTVLLCCAPLCACSTDFSAQIDETMDGLYSTLYNALELFFKQTGDENGDSDKEQKPSDSDQPNDPNAGGENSGGGNTGNENIGGENGGENVGGGVGDDENISGGEGGSNGGENGGEDNNEPSEPSVPKYEIGTQVGQKLPSYSVQIFDENGLSGEYIDPSALGKVTVINFWGTWCPPCVKELPEFSEVASEYKDKVTIVAIHSVDYFTTNAVSHIKNNFADSDIIFAKDINLGEGNVYYDECYESFGGNNFYPYTIIIDENGIITYAKEGALSKASLIAKIEAALES